MINYMIYDRLLMFFPYFKFVHYIDPSARARKSFITAFHTIKKAAEFNSNNSFSIIMHGLSRIFMGIPNSNGVKMCAEYKAAI